MTLGSLLARVSLALHGLPGAEALYLFGSAADPLRKDPYSDLDLQVISADFARSRSAWPWILSTAGEINLVYSISESPHDSAFLISFAGESPYHKVDIGLSDARHPSAFLDQVENKVCLWVQPGEQSMQQPCENPTQPTPVLPYPSAALVPEPGTPIYFLIGEMLSSVRYLKARKRGQHLTCWRFLSAKFNALLRCYLWNHGNPQFPAASLNTWDYIALDRHLPAPERLRLLEMLNCRSPQSMDSALLELTRRIASRIYPDYLTDAALAAERIREYFRFIQGEMCLEGD